MPRDIPLGNGTLLVDFDLAYNLRDIYFPHVGQEKYMSGHPCRLGLEVDGRFTWLSHPSWQREVRYEPDTLVSDVRCTHDSLGLQVVCTDAVDCRRNVLARHVQVRDRSTTDREVQLFFHFEFCAALLEESNYSLNGYFMHRYTPTGEVAGSWHPSVGEGWQQLPIQEDETALIIDALWKHYQHTGCVESMRGLYESMVRPAGDFMLIFRDHETGLPQPCFDLWEEKHGVFLFTCAAVYAGLRAAASFAEAFDDPALAAEYHKGAEEIRQGVRQHMVLDKADRYCYRLCAGEDLAVQSHVQGSLQPDLLFDSSLVGAFIYGLLEADDPRFVRTMEGLKTALYERVPVGGMARHDEDGYHHLDGDYARYPGNPWFVSTLWLADWMIARAKEEQELAPARDILEWTVAHALPSGVLAEQLHPDTGAPLSVSPLTWSHAAFVTTVHRYLRKAREVTC